MKLYIVILRKLSLIVFMTIVTLAVRFIMLTYLNIDILAVDENFIESFLAFFGINTIRVLANYLLDYLLAPISNEVGTVLFSNPQPGPFGQGLPAPGPPAQGPAPGPPVQGPVTAWGAPPAPVRGNPNIFTVVTGNYVVADPTLVRSRGFLDIITNRPHNASYQPYARNLAAALADLQNVHGGSMSDFPGIERRDIDFAKDTIRYQYPNRAPNAIQNSRALQRYLRNLH